LAVRQPPPLALRCVRRLDSLGDDVRTFARTARDVPPTRRILTGERIPCRNVTTGDQVCEGLRLALARFRERRFEGAVELGATRSGGVGEPGRHRPNSISRDG